MYVAQLLQVKAFFISRHYITTISAIISFVFVLTKCIDKEKEIKTTTVKRISFEQFAGSAKCATCHKEIFENHIHTGHYLTSQLATEKTIKGTFKAGKNKFYYNPDLIVAMEKRDSGFYQVVYYKGLERKALKFDIIIGSGTRGQTFTYSDDNVLFQLPVSYYTFANQWAKSPGFPAKVQIDRPITSRCLECHTTFAQTISAPDNKLEQFYRTHIIFGVDCEKCHGPAARHVEFQLQNPQEKKGKYIINPSNFSRQQKLDLCALCHGGRLEKTRPSFTFEAGDNLSEYFELDTLSSSAINLGNVDAHGNQYGLLKASKCFRMSKDLTCNTCHDTHENERGKLALFSQRCMICHKNEHTNFNSMNNVSVSSVKENCIDCHMPAKPSNAIVVFSSGADIPTAALFRSHFISIYADETKKFITTFNKK